MALTKPRFSAPEPMRICDDVNSIHYGNVKLKTYIVLVDVAIRNLSNFKLIDPDLNRLANSVEGRTKWKVCRRVLEFAFVSIVSETTDILRLHDEDKRC